MNAAKDTKPLASNVGILVCDEFDDLSDRPYCCAISSTTETTIRRGRTEFNSLELDHQSTSCKHESQQLVQRLLTPPESHELYYIFARNYTTVKTALLLKASIFRLNFFFFAEQSKLPQQTLLSISVKRTARTVVRAGKLNSRRPRFFY